MAANVWNNQLNQLERAVLSPYGNIQALFTALPFDGKDTEMSAKLRDALQDKSGFIPMLNADFAGRLNAGLADPAVRDKIVKLNAEDPATLNTILDAAIKNPAGLVDRIKATPLPSEADASKLSKDFAASAAPKKAEPAPEESAPKPEAAPKSRPAETTPAAAAPAPDANADKNKEAPASRAAPEALSGNPGVWAMDSKTAMLIIGLLSFGMMYFFGGAGGASQAPETVPGAAPAAKPDSPRPG